MNFIKKAIAIFYLLISLGWICFGVYGVVLNLSYLTRSSWLQLDILSVCLLTAAYCILVLSQGFCVYESFRIHFKSRGIRHYSVLVVINAILVCLIPSAYGSSVWYQILGELNNHPIIYLIMPLLTSEFYCVVTMLNMLLCNHKQGLKM